MTLLIFCILTVRPVFRLQPLCGLSSLSLLHSFQALLSLPALIRLIFPALPAFVTTRAISAHLNDPSFQSVTCRRLIHHKFLKHDAEMHRVLLLQCITMHLCMRYHPLVHALPRT